MAKYVDTGVEMLVEYVKSGLRECLFGFNCKSADINNILRLFDGDQLIQSPGDNIFYNYVLLDDGRLLSFSYYYEDDLCHVECFLRKDSNDLIAQTVSVPQHPDCNFFQIIDAKGEIVVDKKLVAKYISKKIKCNIQEVMRPVSISQLNKRGIIDLNQENYISEVVGNLVKILCLNKINCYINEYDEDMEQAGIYKIFDEDQIVLTKCKNGIESCLAIVNGNVLKIILNPPVDNSRGNTYYIALNPNADEYFIEPLAVEDGRTRIQIINDRGLKLYPDELPTYLNDSKTLGGKKKLSEVIRPSTLTQILERSSKQIDK